MGDVLKCFLIKIFFLFQKKYDKEWDDKVKTIINNIKNGGEIEVGEHTISLNHNSEKIKIWIENFPYSYGYLYVKNEKYVPNDFQYRPSIKTMLRLNSITKKKQEDKKRTDRKEWY